MIRPAPLFLTALVLAACQSALPRPFKPEVVQLLDQEPQYPRPGTCWEKSSIPDAGAPLTGRMWEIPSSSGTNGSDVKPAADDAELQESDFEARKDIWFETPCREVLTPEFIASLQRALKARNLYAGPVTGEYGTQTSAAVYSYQAPQGLQTGVLSIAAARQMGLVAILAPY
ncbi:Putative peptidoglycan binding domain protein [Roseovarius litorisediminis]|uniref:Putative peptidoglycan binding domain protein n=1 Tax=Roseovarius litorisediminis TaxID=1312363 RepID=A0A1Y5S2L4_9RHOB|nr:peptidoglycan-binding domain-containing protein [Roseovarius litorisediminis]SLN30228.1 Putative peptidoglycan binding domain protein [Roseovarius litorisediminis]